MTRRRVRIAKGVYRDQYGISAIVRVRPHPQKELRFPFGTTLKEIQAKRGEERTKLLALDPKPTRGTFKAEAREYLKLQKHLVSYASRCNEIGAWTQLYGHLRRRDLKPEHILKARQVWLAQKYAPKTINHRVRALTHLYHVLDGASVITPCDEVEPLPVPSAEPRLVSAAVIRKVAGKITDRATQARFMVLTATGRRPSELKRAQPTDVDLKRRLWIVRTGKGGQPTPLYLSDDMLAAWRRFVQVGAWGAFDVSEYAKALYAAGWPREWVRGGRRRRNAVRPYNARHSVAITLGEQGADWEDLRDWLGHSSIKTTRMYTGVLASRLKATSAKLTGRLGWKSLKLSKKAG